MNLLVSPISNLKGVGKIQAKRLAELNIHTIGDLLRHFPLKFQDMRRLLNASTMQAGESGTLEGVVSTLRSRKSRAGRLLIEALVRVGEQDIPVMWFGNKFLLQQVKEKELYRFSGTVNEEWPAGPALKNPMFEPAHQKAVQTGRLLPVYPLVAGITIRMMRRYINLALTAAKNLATQDMDPLPQYIRAQEKLPDLLSALKMIHEPQDEQDIAKAKARFALEEVFLLQLATLERRKNRENSRAPHVEFKEQQVKEFVEKLPFPLTGAQKKAAWAMLGDMQKNTPMHRLLNGDVGAGKTAVAAIAAANVAANNAQTAILAPTEILARQHFAGFTKMFAHAPVTIALLTSEEVALATEGKVEKLKKKALEPLIRENMVHCVIGTHALLEEWVKMPALALAIVDEQHRFGVKQRKTLLEKRADTLQPHFLSMTATPIPRSLALAWYGDVDVSVLDELPKGRAPITTQVLAKEVAFQEMERLMAAGEKGYVVCPAIIRAEGSEKASVEEVLAEITKRFPKVKSIGLHGKMSAEEKAAAMDALKTGAVQCVVSTTVVEVGVDVPDAVFMAIVDADGFGLAQLHQLRGRVGRGTKPGYCFLIPKNPKVKNSRLAFVAENRSGFKIAEFDLKLRGQGDVVGTTQSGVPELRFAGMDNMGLMEKAQAYAKDVLAIGISPLLREEIDARFTTHAA